MVPLPECASGEWGPAKAYRLFGMIPLTHEDAIISCNRRLEISFRYRHSYEYYFLLSDFLTAR